MPQNNTDVVGRKSGKLLQGLLMGLYGISGVEANPEYLAPGVEGPVGQGGNLPFKGSGPFGGLKAKGANAEFQGQNALADAATARNIAMLPRKLAIENSAAMDLARSQSGLEQENLLTAKGNQGAALGTGLAELSPEQLQTMGVPRTFNSPQQQYDWYNQAYGAATPLIKAPGIAAEQSNIYKLESNPLTLANRQQAEINKGNIQLGGSIFNPSAPEGQQYIRGDSWQPHQETVEVPTGEMTLGPNGELVPKMGVKVISRQEFNPGGMGDITNLRVTEDELNAARDIIPPLNTPRQFSVDEAPTTPPTTTTLTTKPPTAPLTGLVPNTLNALSSVAQPGLDIAKSAGSSLSTGVENAGNLLGNARKLLIRREGEQFAPMVPDANPIMSNPFPWLGPLMDLESIPIITNEALNPTPNPLPIPQNILLKYLQNRAVTAGRNFNLQSR